MTTDVDQVLELIAAVVLGMGAMLFLLAHAERAWLSAPAPRQVDPEGLTAPALAEAAPPMTS